MTGKEVKKLIYSHGIKLWQIADKLGIRDTKLSYLLRYDFSEDEVNKIKVIIADIEAEQKEPTADEQQ